MNFIKDALTTLINNKSETDTTTEKIARSQRKDTIHPTWRYVGLGLIIFTIICWLFPVIFCLSLGRDSFEEILELLIFSFAIGSLFFVPALSAGAMLYLKSTAWRLTLAILAYPLPFLAASGLIAPFHNVLLNAVALPRFPI